MSVRKLALAIKSRVNVLRERLVASPRRSFGTVALIAAATGWSACTPGECLAQAQVAPAHTPFQDPFAFDPDFNWFEPIYQADFDDMKPKKRANRGWFATYDRMNLYTSRPEQEAGNTRLDSGWGNRYDLGFMLDEDSGWLASFTDLNGPNQFDGFDRERLNRLNEEQQVVILSTGGEDGEPGFTIFPRSDRNNPGFNSRFVPIRNSENVVNFNSFELNKTWRLEPYHYGGQLEPLVGFRYMKFADLYQRMEYRAFLREDPPLNPTPLPEGATEEVLTTRSHADNDMFGGQIGFRYFKYQDRFRYSAELRVFTLANFQSNKFEQISEQTIYGGTTVGLGDESEAYIIDKTRPLYGRNEEFAFGFDIRTEVSYQLTRMFEIRGGMQIIDVAQGLWRGSLLDPLARTDQQALMIGGTFGIALNR